MFRVPLTLRITYLVIPLIRIGDNASSYTLTFNLKFQHSGDTVYIAQCYPYTYSNLQSYLHEIQVKEKCLSTLLWRVAFHSIFWLSSINL